MKKTRIYIAGKVSGENYDIVLKKFSEAEEKLDKQGFVVVNPTKLCKKTWNYRKCMETCITELVKCDEIYLLPDWYDSKGAVLERNIARTIGMKITEE